MNRTVALRIAFASVALSAMSVGASIPQAQGPDARTIKPAGLTISNGIDLWQEPWVFEARGAERKALAALDNSDGFTDRVGPIPIRLNDRSVGTLSAEAGPCGPQDACIGPRADCGCFADDSYWIQIADSRGRRIKRLHFWAAYRMFQIVPVDIVGGPGDELLIFRVPAHASPPIGYDIKIWEIDQAAPRDLANREHVAGHLPAVKSAVSCVLWRMTFSVDPNRPKPRPLTLQIEASASSDCPATETAGIAVDRLQPKGPLTFDPVRGKYVFPPGSALSSN